MSLLRDIGELFWPRTCPVCGGRMGDGARVVCSVCRANAPLTGYWEHVDNPVVRKFWGIVPVINASSFLFFVHGNGYRELIHGFKYRGMWRLAVGMGEWFGGELSRSGLYGGVDVVVPVPLHFRKRLVRGYNQAEYIACGIASQLDVPVDCRSVVRSRYNPSQTRREHKDRWNNVEGIFSVRHPGRLAGKHLLLVDDVLTTGATISSCAEAVITAVPDVRISIATLAVARSGIETA